MLSGCNSEAWATLRKLMVLASMALPMYSQTAPDPIAAHFHSAKEAEKRNDFPAAVREYEYLVSALPRNAGMQSNLGVALYFDHELTRSLKVFQRAISLDPKLLAPHLFSGLAWYHLSNPDAAVPELEQAVRIQPSDPVAHTWLGYAYIAQFRYDAAAREFEAACQLAPNDIDGWYALGQSYLQIGNDATLKLLALAPDGARAWQLAGEQFQLRGDKNKALDDFKEANARRPGLPELQTLITSLGGTVSPSPAISSSPAMEHKEGGPEDDLYLQAHQAEEKSRTALERVMQIAPESYRAHQVLADSLIAQKRSDEAIQEYRTVLQLKPDLSGIHEAIGNSLIANGRLEEALKEFTSELQLQPDSATAHMNVARVLLLTGDNEGAGKMLARALQEDRPPIETYILLGKLELRRSNDQAAIVALTHYIGEEKGNSDAYYLLSRAYRATGDKEQMNRALESFKKISQDARDRKLAQTQLESLRGKRLSSSETVDVQNPVLP